MKEYVKPDLLFEDYEMSVGVAACTGVIVGKDGFVKQYIGEGYESIFKELGLFTDVCPMSYKDAGFEDYGYYGGSGIIFGS